MNLVARSLQSKAGSIAHTPGIANAYASYSCRQSSRNNHTSLSSILHPSAPTATQFLGNMDSVCDANVSSRGGSQNYTLDAVLGNNSFWNVWNVWNGSNFVLHGLFPLLSWNNLTNLNEKQHGSDFGLFEVAAKKTVDLTKNLVSWLMQLQLVQPVGTAASAHVTKPSFFTTTIGLGGNGVKNGHTGISAILHASDRNISDTRDARDARDGMDASEREAYKLAKKLKKQKKLEKIEKLEKLEKTKKMASEESASKGYERMRSREPENVPNRSKFGANIPNIPNIPKIPKIPKMPKMDRMDRMEGMDRMDRLERPEKPLLVRGKKHGQRSASANGSASGSASGKGSEKKSNASSTTSTRSTSNTRSTSSGKSSSSSKRTVDSKKDKFEMDEKSIKELREFINVNGWSEDIKTSGKGRTKMAIIRDIVHKMG